MFIGEYTHKIDDKGRLALPAKFRENLSGGGVVTRSIDRSLYLFTAVEWEAYASKLASVPSMDKRGQMVARHILAGAVDVVPDKQGRISLPPYLRAHAGLDGASGSKPTEAVVAGLGKRIEIWSAEAWSQALPKADKEIADLAEHLSQLGI